VPESVANRSLADIVSVVRKQGQQFARKRYGDVRERASFEGAGSATLDRKDFMNATAFSITS
jgi:hypothetical protein